MKHQYKLIVSNKNFYKEFEILDEMEKIHLGTTPLCEFRINPDLFFNPIELLLEKVNNQWQIACDDEVYFSKGDMRKLMVVKIKHADLLEVRYSESENEAFEIRFLINFDERVPFYNYYIKLPLDGVLSIGNGPNNDITINSEFTDNTLFEIDNKGESYILREKSSPYGITLNGKSINSDKILVDHDFIFVADFSFYYKEGSLYFDDQGIRVNNIPVIQDENISSFKYPKFIRNVRKKIIISNEQIKILDPSVKPTKPEMNIVTSLMPSIAMFALVVVLRGFMNTTGGTYILFSICSMGLGIITTIAGLVQGQKKYKKDLTNREKVYIEYISKKEEEIKIARNDEINLSREMYYSPSQGIEKVRKFEADIFDRIPQDDDFLDLYLGEGQRISSRQIDYKNQERLESGDELAQIPSKLYEQYRYIDNVPIIMKLKDANAVGIVGDEPTRYTFFKNIVADIVCRQYHTDVRFYLLIDSNTSQYDWIKILPQINTKDKGRNIVFDNSSKTNIFENLYKELTYRAENEGNYEHIIVFVMKENGITSHPVSKFIEIASSLQATFIFLEKSIDYLPLYCSQIIELNNNIGKIYDSNNKAKVQAFRFNTIPNEEMYSLAKKVAPVYCEEISLENTLRKNISMFEMLGIYMPDDLDLNKRWSESQIYDSMAAPLGVNAKNEIVYLDIHEKAHGPHGLIAGTTGSGKSELLQSYILSLATIFHPFNISHTKTSRTS